MGAFRGENFAVDSMRRIGKIIVSLVGTCWGGNLVNQRRNPRLLFPQPKLCFAALTWSGKSLQVIQGCPSLMWNQQNTLYGHAVQLWPGLLQLVHRPGDGSQYDLVLECPGVEEVDFGVMAEEGLVQDDVGGPVALPL